MERRFVLAFALSFLVLLVYPHFLQRFYPAQKRVAQMPLPANNVEEKALPSRETLPRDSGGVVLQETKLDYEDSVYAATFTNLGAGMTSLSLKAFANGVAHGNFLMEESKGIPPAFTIRIFRKGAWEESAYKLERKEDHSVVFVSEEPGQFRVKKSFRFLPETYTLALQLDIENLSSGPQTFPCELVAPLFVGDTPDRNKMNLEVDYVKEGQMEVKSAQALAKQGFLKEGPLEWVALEKKYFALVIKPETRVEYARSSYNKTFLTHSLKLDSADVAPGETLSRRFVIYAGPKSYDALKSSRLGFEKILHTKILGGFWIYFLILLKFFYKIFHNYGVAIIVLSSLIKLIFAPLTHMSFDSMRKMQALQPKLKALQEQHKKDPQKLNQEVMELYKKHKANPFGGCLPLLLQMPIFVALYQTFSTAIELRGAPFFGWVTDLSEPDRLFLLPFSLPFLGNQVNVLPVLMLGTMVWQQKITPQTAATKEQEMMTTLMPIMFGFIFYSLPSGLVLYWIVNNLLTIFHQMLMKKFHIAPTN